MIKVKIFFWEQIAKDTLELQDYEKSFSSEKAAKRFIEEEVKWEGTERCECPELDLIVYGDYAVNKD